MSDRMAWICLYVSVRLLAFSEDRLGAEWDDEQDRYRGAVPRVLSFIADRFYLAAVWWCPRVSQIVSEKHPNNK